MSVNEDILFYAFRYALGRETYAVKQVVNEIIIHWPTISQKLKVAVRTEIIRAIDTGNAGAVCDMENWKKILDLGVE